MIKHWTLLILSLVAINGCEPVKDPLNSDGVIKVKDSDLSIGEGSSARNVLSYAQSEKPHRQIEKDFVVKSTSGWLRIRALSVTTSSCSKGNADVSLYLFSQDKLSQLAGETDFRATSGDRLRVIVNNPGECQAVSVNFEVLRSSN